MKLGLLSFIGILFVGAITGCGGGGGTDNSNNANITTSNRITLSGNDADEFNGELQLTDFSFIPGTGTAEAFLTAIGDDPIVINTFDIDGEENNGIKGISMRINNENGSWLYSSTICPTCDEVNFDLSKRTLTFSNAVVNPTIGGSANSQSTSPLTMNGTLAWTQDHVNKGIILPTTSNPIQNETPDIPKGSVNEGTCNDEDLLTATLLTSEMPACSGRVNSSSSGSSMQFTTGPIANSHTISLTVTNPQVDAYFELYESFSDLDNGTNYQECDQSSTGGESCSFNLDADKTYYIFVWLFDQDEIATDYTITVSGL